MTAAVAARQLGTAIRAVIPADPAFLSPERQHEVHEGDVLEQHRQFLQAPKEALLADLRHPHRPPELLEYIADARLATRVSAFEALVPPNPDYRELVSHIRVPILLVMGDKGVVSVDAARELASLNQRLRYALIPDSGHGFPYRRAAGEHEPALSGVRMRERAESAAAGSIRLHRMRLRGERRCRRRG